MVFFITGMMLFGIFDAIELINDSKTHEKIIYSALFTAVLAAGIWFYMNKG